MKKTSRNAAPAVAAPGPAAAADPPAAEVSLTLGSLQAVAAKEMPRVLDIWRKLDADGSGQVDIKEFIKGLSSCFPNASKADMKALFHECDRDGNGTVQYDELVRTLRNFAKTSEASAVDA